ncbi:MAG: ABC transporter ATP-binding protein [Longimicrobiaceae bacterium]
MSEGAVVRARALRKTFVGGDGSPIEVLSGVELEVGKGESVAITGESGTGKSTLLHLLGGLDLPSAGEVELAGHALAGLDGDALARLRGEWVGFVFQFHHLLREFNALENVAMPRLIAGEPRAGAEERARQLLDAVGLSHRLGHRPAQLSGGEQQRVAVARALANQPAVLLADEPSGNLDTGTSERLHDLLFEVSAAYASATVIVTHDRGLAARADRQLVLAGGRLAEG